LDIDVEQAITAQRESRLRKNETSDETAHASTEAVALEKPKLGRNKISNELVHGSTDNAEHENTASRGYGLGRSKTFAEGIPRSTTGM
jgi:hypothetical protein